MNKVSYLTEGVKAYLRTIKNGKRTKPDYTNDRELFIVGNGPSKNEVDLDKVSRLGLDILVVNFYGLCEEELFRVKPSHYCLLDYRFYEGDKTDPRIEQLRDILRKVDWPMKLVTFQGNKLDLGNSHIIYEYISSSALRNDNINSFYKKLYRNNYAICGGQNVVSGSLCYALIKGYKNVYVTGIDMSEMFHFSVTKDNRVFLNAEHFYGNKVIDYTANGRIKKGEFAKYLECYVIMFKEFSNIAKVAKMCGLNIINLSVNSYLDCFEKMSFSEFINGK